VWLADSSSHASAIKAVQTEQSEGAEQSVTQRFDDEAGHH